MCPYCGAFLPYWPRGAPAALCVHCRRPLVIVPASTTLDRFRIFSVFHLAKIAVLPVVGGLIVAFATARLSPDAFAYGVSLALLAWGSLDVWDGTSGLESGLDRVRRNVRTDRAAKRSSISKTVFGSASIALGAAGLLLTG